MLCKESTAVMMSLRRRLQKVNRRAGVLVQIGRPLARGTPSDLE